MELTRITTGNCGRDDCPNIYVTDRGTLAVQGYRLDVAAGDGEAVVEIPRDILREAVRALGW